MKYKMIMINIVLAALMLFFCQQCYAYTPKVVSVSAGYSHVLALCDDGTVWAWGSNECGEIGNGDKDEDKVVTAPTKVGIANVTAVSAHFKRSYALKEDGTVWAWGANNYHWLGDGTLEDRTTPVRVGTLTHIVAISAGYGANYALKDDGTVWAWGSNRDYTLGDGTNATRDEPVQVKINGVKNLGDRGSVAISRDNLLWAWGDNVYGNNDGQYFYGLHGDDSNISWIPAPIPVSKVPEAIAVSEGRNHVVFLKADGTVWTWGSNYYGQTGDGSVSNNRFSIIRAPVKADICNIIGIAAGDYSTIALSKDGSVWLWGRQSILENFLPMETKVSSPRKVVSDNVINISAGPYYNVIVKKDGTVWGWGRNEYGELRLSRKTVVNEPVLIIDKLPDNGLPECTVSTPVQLPYTVNTSVSASPLMNASPVTSAIITSRPTSTPGFTSRTVALLCSITIIAGLLSNVICRKRK